MPPFRSRRAHAMSKLVQVDQFITPGLSALLPSGFSSIPAIAMLYTIGRQESRFEHTVQVGGPAHGYWQFELGGGVKGVTTHPASAPYARIACEREGVTFERTAIYDALPNNPRLACALARLLLYTDPQPLPAVLTSMEEEAWQYYTRNWRPGKPHRETWTRFWREAVDGLVA